MEAIDALSDKASDFVARNCGEIHDVEPLFVLYDAYVTMAKTSRLGLDKDLPGAGSVDLDLLEGRVGSGQVPSFDVEILA